MTAILLETHFNACAPLLKNTSKRMWMYVCNDTLLELIYVSLPDTQWPLNDPKGENEVGDGQEIWEVTQQDHDDQSTHLETADLSTE